MKWKGTRQNDDSDSIGEKGREKKEDKKMQQVCHESLEIQFQSESMVKYWEEKL